MTDEFLDRVRAVDPLPEGSTAPPFETVFAAATDMPRGHGRRRRRFVNLLVPVVSVAVAIGVMVAAVTLLHTGHPRSRGDAVPGHRRAHNARMVPTSTARVPTGGMSGVVSFMGAGFNAAGDGVISLEQCLGCQRDGNQTSHSRVGTWLLTTSDGGRSWTRSARGYYLQHPLLIGRDGWAGGLQLLSRRQGGGAAQWEPGAGVADYFVTHDGGRSWSVAPTAAPNEGGSVASVLGGEVWAVGLTPSRVTILHSAVGGDRLSATASQPIRGDSTNVVVEGAGAGSAYAVNGNVPDQAFSTHDNGHTWQRLTPPPCTGKLAYARLDAAFGNTIWLTCSASNGRPPALLRSLDGGRSWQGLSVFWGRGGPQQLTAASAQVAWALNSHGELLRTSDGGATWQSVWSASEPHVSPLSRPVTKLTAFPLPILSVQSTDSASIVTLLNRGPSGRASKLTTLVVYRTSDGGRTWQTYPVGL